ncbi:MAG: leucyl/phenylalanyl-tRNA--protein transferase [Arenicella sp.]
MLPEDAPGYIQFPDVSHTDSNGLLAQGGNLEAETLISAYQQGVFPWFSDGQPILWWSPDPRMVLSTSAMKRSRSLRKTLRSDKFKVTCDQAFSDVIQACSAPRATADGTWITEEMKQAYMRLHHLGYAHSIECWHQDKLVGGLYGIAIKTLFFGESMFSHTTDSSKVALSYLCDFLHSQGVQWIDCQVESEHLASLGACNIPRSVFINDIQLSLQLNNKIDWETFADSVKSNKL